MPSLSAAKHFNAALKLDSPISVVVGGTNGIGAAIAVKIAQYSENPTVHIVGRNESAAQSVLAQMRDVSSHGTYEFHKADVSLLSQVHPLIEELRTSLPVITHLVLTPGILTTAGRTETTEGNDVKMMLHYYSRYLFMRGLMPSLDAGNNAKVMTVLDAKRGNPKSLDWNDLDLKKTYSLGNAANHCITMNDVAVQHLAHEHPTVSFTHAYPGLVATNIFSNMGLPSFITTPSRLLINALATSSSDCGEWLFAAMQKGKPGEAQFVDNHGDAIKNKVQASEEQVDKVVKHTNGIVDKS